MIIWDFFLRLWFFDLVQRLRHFFFFLRLWLFYFFLGLQFSFPHYHWYSSSFLNQDLWQDLYLRFFVVMLLFFKLIYDPFSEVVLFEHDCDRKIYCDFEYLQASLFSKWKQYNWTIRLEFWVAGNFVVKYFLCILVLRHNFTIGFHNHSFDFLTTLFCLYNAIIFIQVWNPSKLYEYNILWYEHYLFDICFFVLPVIICKQESLATFKSRSKVEELFILLDRKFIVLILLNFCFDIFIKVLLFQNSNHCLCSSDFLGC